MFGRTVFSASLVIHWRNVFSVIYECFNSLHQYNDAAGKLRPSIYQLLCSLSFSLSQFSCGFAYTQTDMVLVCKSETEIICRIVLTIPYNYFTKRLELEWWKEESSLEHRKTDTGRGYWFNYNRRLLSRPEAIIIHEWNMYRTMFIVQS